MPSSFIFAEVPNNNVGTYQEAVTECERLNVAEHLGRSNWRLPTVSELLPSSREVNCPAWCCDPSPHPETAWVVSQNSFFVQMEGVTRRALILPVSEDPAGPEPERKVTTGKSRLPMVTVGRIMSHGPCPAYPESRVRDLIGRGKTALEIVDLLIPASDRLWVLTLPGVLPLPVFASMVERALLRKRGALTDGDRRVIRATAGQPTEQDREEWNSLCAIYGEAGSAQIGRGALRECAYSPDPDNQEIEYLLQCRDARDLLAEEEPKQD